MTACTVRHQFSSTLLALLVVACSNNHYYRDTEKALGTNGRVTSQHHLAVYYPSGISLNFPGYVVALEDSTPRQAARDGELVIENPTDAGSDIPRITDTMREFYLPFISHIIRYQGERYGKGNCALYSIYRNAGRAITQFCPGMDAELVNASDDPRSAYRNSWKAIDILKREIPREVATGEYSHLIVAMMGLDTSQEESIRNFKDIVWSIRNAAGDEFKPLFIGITWPSFVDGRWADPLWELAAYPFKADEADRLGLSWIGVLLHEVIIPLSDKIPTGIISQSFGTRALSMGACVGPAIRNGAHPIVRATDQIDVLIGVGAAMSLERLRTRKLFLYEDVSYPNACDRVKSFAITTTDHDIAIKYAVWADLAGNYNYFKPMCNDHRLPYSLYCTRADNAGNIELNNGVVPKLIYIDTTELMPFSVPGTQGGAHSDMFRPETGRMLWRVLQYTAVKASAPVADGVDRK